MNLTMQGLLNRAQQKFGKIWKKNIENLEFDTFQQHANKVCNKLSVNIRICENKISLVNKARGFYKDKALARAMFL